METVVFDVGSLDERVCIDFEILEDLIAELTEDFTIHLVIEDGASSAVSNHPYADVHILDNDREL